jgi:hypothetical protein
MRVGSGFCTRCNALAALTLAVSLAVAANVLAAPPTGDAESAAVESWRADRVARLTSETGWLTLVGLYWLQDGENTFGRAQTNTLVLNHAALPATLGSFFLKDGAVRFVARPAAVVSHDGQPVREIELKSDSEGEPTVLAAGSLRVFVISRAGHLGIRVRDTEHPLRRSFRGLQYFPIRTDWVIEARFEPYEPARHVSIINILGMQEEMVAPGALVFEKDGRAWRLDALLEEPDAKELFVMFADATTGKETYGAGRFLYTALPIDGKVRLDFNEAYNPPCAFNDFATCPLPPTQNRLRLRIDAGELKYTRFD